MTRLWLVLLGAWVGVVGMLVHRQAVHLGAVGLPWGVVAAIVTTAVVVHAAGSWRSIGGAWFAIGWILTVMADQELSGSALIVADPLGWTFLGGSLAVIALDVATTSRLRS